MATEIKTDPQSKAEIRAHYMDFTQDLPEGVTVQSAAVTHTPPAGGQVTTPTVSVSGAVVAVTLGPVDILGRHYLDIVATLSDGQKSEARLLVPVIF